MNIIIKETQEKMMALINAKESIDKAIDLNILSRKVAIEKSDFIMKMKELMYHHYIIGTMELEVLKVVENYQIDFYLYDIKAMIEKKVFEDGKKFVWALRDSGTGIFFGGIYDLDIVNQSNYSKFFLIERGYLKEIDKENAIKEIQELQGL